MKGTRFIMFTASGETLTLEAPDYAEEGDIGGLLSVWWTLDDQYHEITINHSECVAVKRIDGLELED